MSEGKISDYGDRSNIKKNTLSFSSNLLNINIRPDSPKTKEACLELGIDLEIFKQKQITEFGDKNTPFFIKEFRAKHYNEKVVNLIKAVLKKKKEYMKENSLKKKQFSVSETSTIFPKFSTLNNENNEKNLQYLNTFSNFFKQSNSINQSIKEIPLPSIFVQNYQKTLDYFKQSHISGATIKSTDIINLEKDDDINRVDSHLIEEIEKFNRNKLRKQKIALNIFENEFKLIQNIEKMERNKKKLEITQTISNQKIKNKIMSHREFESRKNEKLKEIHDDLIKKTKLLSEKMAETTKQKEIQLLLKNQERKRKEMLLERSSAEKFQKINSYRYTSWMNELNNADKNLISLNEKMEKSNGNYMKKMIEKTEKLKEQAEKKSLSLLKCKERENLNNDKSLQAFVTNLIKKEDAIENRKIGEYIIKEKLKKSNFAKTQKIYRIQENLKSKELNMYKENEKKQKDFNNKLKKKEQNDYKLKIFQLEKRNLKLFDVFEKHNRTQKIIDYKNSKILEKDRINTLSLAFNKFKKEILKTAKWEASKQYKIEDERITNKLEKLSEIVYNSSTKGNNLPLNKTIKALTAIIDPNLIEKVKNKLMIPEKRKQSLPSIKLPENSQNKNNEE